MVLYDVRGAGPAAILLVRPLGGRRELWGAFRDALGGSLRVIAYDRSVTGSTRAMAREALAVLDAAGVARAHVFGLSLGGMVATWLAADQPRRVDRLILASTEAVARVRLRRAASLARCFARRGGEVEACLARRVLSGEFRRERPGAVAWIEAEVRRRPASRATLLRHVAAAARHDASATLGRITAPTLVLAGGRDRLVGAAAGAALAREIRGARFEVIEEAGHDLCVERPLETAARVLAFVTPGL